MDRDRQSYERALELLMARQPLTGSQAEELFDILTAYRDHRAHRSVANYIANELGYNRNKIAQILDERIEARNVPHLVAERVERYFHASPDGTNRTQSAVEEMISNEVSRYVRQKLQDNGAAFIDAKAHEIAECLFAEKAPGAQGTFSPNLMTYPAAALVGWGLLAATALRHLERLGTENQPDLDVEKHPERPGDPFDIVLRDARHRLGEDAFQKLAGELGRNDMWGLEHHMYGTWSMPKRLKLKILTEAVGGFEVRSCAMAESGILCLPA